MLKIYLTDLAAYNKGYLYGEWIELPQNQSMLNDKLHKILKDGEALCYMECGYYEKHEEYFITDYKWDDVEIFEVDEYEHLFELNKRLEELEALEPYDHKAVSFLLSHGIANDIYDAIEKADDVVIHQNYDMSDIAYDFIRDNYNIHDLSPIIANHIDYNGIGRDLEYDGTYYEVGNDIYEYIS